MGLPLAIAWAVTVSFNPIALRLESVPVASPVAAEIPTVANADRWLVGLRDASGAYLATQSVSSERRVACAGAPPRFAFDATRGARSISREHTATVFLPPLRNATWISLEDDGGRLVAAETLPKLPDVRRRSFAALERRYDVVVLGHQYASVADLNADVRKFRDGLSHFEVFRKVQNKIRFSVEKRVGDLGCTYDGRILSCDEAAVAKRAARVGHFDHIAVFSNTTTYGGASFFGPAGVPEDATGGMSRGSYFAASAKNAMFPLIAVHELGHLLGLHDEYTYDDDPESAAYWQTAKTNYGPNCAHSLPTPWLFYQPKKGCVRSDWFRPDDSLMAMLEHPWFNQPSEQQLRRAIQSYAP